jgi:hypothetical protein
MKLVIKTNLCYDARSEKHQITVIKYIRTTQARRVHHFLEPILPMSGFLFLLPGDW